jgi:hypothetical protein
MTPILPNMSAAGPLDLSFARRVADGLRTLPGVVAVTLGGSRAAGTSRCTTGGSSTPATRGGSAGPARSSRSAAGAAALLAGLRAAPEALPGALDGARGVIEDAANRDVTG